MMNRRRRLCFLVVLCVGCAGIAAAQNPTGIGSGNEPSAILDQFRSVRGQWFNTLWPYAAKMFALLAAIQVTWTAIKLMLETNDFQAFTGGVVRRLMTISIFYALLLNGATWLPTIIDSFSTMGQAATGLQGLSPSSIYIRGTDLMGNLDKAASNAGYLTNMGMAIGLELASITSFLCFVGICIQFTVTTVESYILVGAAIVFLGFGGSQWTAPYVERVIALAVAIGVKLLCIYLTISVVMQVSAGWVASAANVNTASDPCLSGWEIAGSSLICLMIAWKIPTFFAGLLGGNPAFVGSDLVSVPASFMGAAMGAGSMILGGGAAMSQTIAAASAAAPGGGGGSAGGSSSPTSPTGSPGGGGSGGGTGGGGAGGGLGSGVGATNLSAVGAPNPAAGGGGGAGGIPQSVPAPAPAGQGGGGAGVLASLGRGMQSGANVANRIGQVGGGGSHHTASAPPLALNHE